MTGPSWRPVRAAMTIALIASLTASCSGGKRIACNSVEDLTKGMTINLPPSLGGLRVEKEPKAIKQLIKTAKVNSYVCDGSVFSLRQGKELRGVLQVARLTPDARPEEKDFRKTIADGSNAKRQPVKIGETLVYQGNFNKQLIQLWFVDHFMMVLTVRESATVAGQSVGVDFRALTAEALALHPVKV